MVLNDMSNTKKSKKVFNFFLESNKHFGSNGDLVFCKFCEFELRYDSHKGILPYISHCKSLKHKNNEILYNNAQNKFSQGYLNSESQNIEFLKIICECNLSFKICNNERLKKFLGDLGFNLKSDTYFRERLLNKKSMEIEIGFMGSI